MAPLSREGPRRSKPDPLGGAGDQYGLAGKLEVHWRLRDRGMSVQFRANQPTRQERGRNASGCRPGTLRYGLRKRPVESAMSLTAFAPPPPSPEAEALRAEVRAFLATEL